MTSTSWSRALRYSSVLLAISIGSTSHLYVRYPQMRGFPMPADTPLLRPRDADALRAELRHVAAAAGLPVTFGGEVHGATLLLTEFVGTRTASMRGLAVRPSAGLGGATMVAGRPMS